jgi:hypothetical protein
MTTNPTPASLSGQNITVNWLMNNPVIIYRALRTLAQQRLIANKVLTGTVDLTGSGSAVFGISEGIFPKRAAEKVKPLGEYPLTDDDPGTPALALTDKWGLSTRIPQELIARNRMDVVRRKMRKLVNQVVFGFDALCLSAVGSAVTQTQPASATWATTATADPFLDLMLAAAVPDSLNQGYSVDVIALSPVYFARAVATAKVLQNAPREGTGNIVVTGNMIQLAGLTFLKSTNLPAGVNVMVLDSTVLGSIASERLGGPGWMGAPDGDDVEVKVIPLDENDGFRIFCRKVAVPMVQEPGAAAKLTGA